MNDGNETNNSETPATLTDNVTPPDTTTPPTNDTPDAALTDAPKADDTPAVIEPVTAEALIIPDGIVVPDEARDKFLEILNGDLSPKDRANALLNLQAETLKAQEAASRSEFDQMQTEWKDEVKSSLGDKLQPTLTNIARLIDENSEDAAKLREVFNMTGAGNNVHVIKFLSKIADQLTEGKILHGSPNNPELSTAERLYPSMQPKG